MASLHGVPPPLTRTDPSSLNILVAGTKLAKDDSISSGFEGASFQTGKTTVETRRNTSLSARPAASLPVCPSAQFNGFIVRLIPNQLLLSK